MSFKISIIMPIFNAEDNLNRSINSIIQQTFGFENIELILVDDKSTDNSCSIIKHFANKFNNIIPVFLEKNSGGASIPRNYGIKKATSEFIMFMDSDDEYSLDLCEKFYNCISSNDVDLVSCNYNTTDNIHTSKICFTVPFEDKQVMSDEITVVGDKIIAFDNVYVWNKIFKKSIILENNILFKETISEDFIFCMEYLLKSKKRAFLKDYYGYTKYLQEESLSIKEISIASVKNHINVDNMIFNLILENIEDKKHVKKLSNEIFKEPIKWVVEELVTVPSKDVKEGLYVLYLFEKKIEFENSLNNIFLNIINKLILKKKLTLASIIIKLGRIFLNSKISRKIYRILSK